MADEERILRPGAIALITGASSGIGKAIADQLLARGLRVICCARRRPALEAAFADQRAATLIHPLDVTDPQATAGLIAALPEDWREIDILIANAGSDVGGRQRFDQGAVEDWAGTIETNVNGVIRVCHAVIPGMLARGRGHVVTVGSVAGVKIAANSPAYFTSKHAVHALSTLLREDFKREPLRITEILPGMVRTDFATARERGDAAAAEAFYEDWPGGYLEAEDVARTALFALEQPPQVNVGQILVSATRDK
ncbi:MAG: SDR family NAD(P)-dependent oxidoreductase [Rhodospirillales bacterium]